MSAILDSERIVVPYNFGRRERISKNQLKSLQSIHERFSRNFSSAISTSLRATVEVSVEETSQVSYAEFLNEANDPTCYAAVSMQPLEGTAAVEFEPEIIFPMIDRLLGGSGLPVSQLRPMTEIEQSVVRTILKILVDSLKESWRQVYAIDFNLTGTDVHPRLVQVIAPDEAVIQVKFRLRMRESIGHMNLVLPLTALEPIIPMFAQESATRKRVIRDSAFVAQLQKAPVSVTVETAETMFPVDQLLSLHVGDTLVLDQRPGSPVQLKIAGKNKLTAQATGDFRRNTFEVTGPYRQSREEKNGRYND